VRLQAEEAAKLPAIADDRKPPAGEALHVRRDRLGAHGTVDRATGEPSEGPRRRIVADVDGNVLPLDRRYETTRLHEKRHVDVLIAEEGAELTDGDARRVNRRRLQHHVLDQRLAHHF
jgi:hypothetical protein